MLKEALEKIEALAKSELSQCADEKTLEDLRVKFLGKKENLPQYLNKWARFRQRSAL